MLSRMAHGLPWIRSLLRAEINSRGSFFFEKNSRGPWTSRRQGIFCGLELILEILFLVRKNPEVLVQKFNVSLGCRLTSHVFFYQSKVHESHGPRPSSLGYLF